jgi:coronin-1B/1C/6
VVHSTCKDKKLRLFDVRAGSEPVKAVESHGGIKASRVCWMGTHDRLATTGFSKLSDRQLFLWDSGNLDKPVKQLNVDASSAGTLMPFWSDNNLLYLAGACSPRRWTDSRKLTLTQARATETFGALCSLTFSYHA